MNKAIVIGCSLLALAIVGWAFAIDGGHARTQRLEKETQALGDDVVRLEKETDTLREKARVLRDDTQDPAAQEEVIREELGYIKKDEHVLWLPEKN